jgi:hypothetical protein
LLFMGEEWGADTPWQFFSDFGDAELVEGVREGRRKEFSRHGWDAEVPDPHDPATREASVLDWSQPLTGVHARVLSWYTDLIRLRRREPDLRDDDLSRVRVDLGAGWVAVRRGGFDVVVNLSDRPVAVPSRGVRAELRGAGSSPGRTAPSGSRRAAPACCAWPDPGAASGRPTGHRGRHVQDRRVERFPEGAVPTRRAPQTCPADRRFPCPLPATTTRSSPSTPTRNGWSPRTG